jgi:pilus assembly protein CpaF
MPDHTTAPPPTPLASLPLFDDTPRSDREPPPAPRTPTARALAGRTERRNPQPPNPRPRRPDVKTPPARPRQHDAAVDWGLVRAFRQQAADQLAAALRDREGLEEAARHELGRRIVLDLLTAHADEALTAGAETFSADEQQVLAAAVFDSLFSLGRLQGLVDQPDVENIEVYGCDKVILEHSDGRLTDGPPVADSDEELVESLQFLASRTGSNDRPFSPLHPHLHLRLIGGARLAATAWVTPRPLVVIRRHRHRDVSIDELVDLGMLSGDLAAFLTAAVRAGYSIVISGPQGCGKTTMLRALCAVLDFEDHLGTFETEYELHLHELPGRHWRVSAFEARPGSGERAPDGSRAGEITLDEHLYNAWRHNLSRLIVGELRGKEVSALFKAMQGAGGSMSTLHAHSARAAIGRIVTLAMETGPSVTESYASRQVGENIQLIVQVQLDTRTESGVRRRSRYVSEVLAIEPRGDGQPTTTNVYVPGPDGRAVPGTLPEWLTGLHRQGFDAAEFPWGVA